MKKLFILVLAIPAILSSCNSSKSNKTTNKNELYLDEEVLKIDDLEFNFYGVDTLSWKDSFNVSIPIDVVNKDPKPYSFTLIDSFITRESDEATYSCPESHYMHQELNLECELKQRLSFSCYLPSSIEKDKYCFTFKYGSKEILFHLYEKPDELRKKISISMIFDDGTKHKETMFEGRRIFGYSWADDDCLYGCNDWHFDEECKNPIQADYKISEPITIYGIKKTVLKYLFPTDTVNSSCFINGFNLIPNTSEIVVPRSFNDKNVYSILVGSFSGACTGLKSIYIPKTVRVSASHNFTDCVDLETVYFEGSETEWANQNAATYPPTTNIVFNTYK